MWVQSKLQMVRDLYLIWVWYLHAHCRLASPRPSSITSCVALNPASPALDDDGGL
jgi:hypothetical protein